MSPSNTAEARHEYADAGTGKMRTGDRHVKESADLKDADSIWKLLAVAANAQCNIWRMKFRRYAVVCLLGIPMLWALLALGIYGFILLDRSVTEMLLAPMLPAWIPSLVRGVVYLGIAACVIGVVWNSFVGKTLLEEE